MQSSNSDRPQHQATEEVLTTSVFNLTILTIGKDIAVMLYRTKARLVSNVGQLSLM